MLGLMQDGQLTVDRFLDHAAEWHGQREIVSREADGSVTRSDYRTLRETAKKVSSALAAAGVQRGDRIATMGWNGFRHLAAWYGATGMGAVLHTLNPRLFPEQIAYIANHAGDRILLVDPGCAPLVPDLLKAAPTIEKVVYLSDTEIGRAHV